MSVPETYSRTLTANDLAEVARIHCAAFPGRALTRLGDEAVRRYYAWQFEGPHDAVYLAACQGDRLIGYLFGGTFRGSLSGFVRKNRGWLIVAVLTHPWCLLSEEFRDRIRTALRAVGSGGGSRPSAPVSVERSFGILAIAVDPAVQGTGAGKVLMLEAERIAREQGFAKMNLSVDPRNVQAVTFYERLGWVRRGAGDAWTGVMDKPLPTDRV